MSLGCIIGRDVLGQKMQDHLSRAACREGLWGDSEGRAQVGRGRKGASPMLQPECRWPRGSFSSSFPASFPAPAPTRYRSLLDAFEGAALEGKSCFFLFSSGNERGFPGGLMVKNPPCNAGNTGLIPGPGRSHRPWGNYAHVPQLPSPSSTTREAITMRSTCTVTKESPHATMKTQGSQKCK